MLVSRKKKSIFIAMRKRIIYSIAFFFLFSCGNKQGKQNDELLVFCAASLTNVMSEITEAFELQQGIDVQLNFASSGTLARQIEHGAKPSIYFSANEKWVDYLIEEKIVSLNTKVKVVGNALVLIVPKTNAKDAMEFGMEFPDQFTGRLAIGDPKHVPAGEYAWQSIQNLGLQDRIADRILPTKDVRSALMMVEMGEVELGIVYKTDALKSEKVKVVAEVPSDLHKPISYFASILNEKNNKQSQLFYKFLTSKRAKEIWLKNGFSID
jgi:molybdate transport system substrate-binding protein